LRGHARKGNKIFAIPESGYREKGVFYDEEVFEENVGGIGFGVGVGVRAVPDRLRIGT